MRIDVKILKGVDVVTPSGLFLGHVVDVIIDTESHMVVQYGVRRIRLAGDILLIGRDQVIRITETQMIVDESVSKEKAKENARLPKRVKAEPAPLMRSEG